MTVVHYLADANFFIQCKAPGELPWGAVTGASEIVLYPAPSAIIEIDRHKGDGSKRRAKRARAVSSKFKQILVSGAGLILRDANPRVILDLPPPLDDEARAHVVKFPEPDQRIVEEGLLYCETLPKISVLSHDTGTLMRARQQSMALTVVPDDWLTEPEPDALERRVASLERELDDLRQTAPVLAVELDGSDGQGVLHLEKLTFTALSNSDVDSAVARIMAPDDQHVADMQRSIGQIRMFATMHTQESVDRHRETLKEWAGELRKKVAQVDRYASLAYAVAPVTLMIANTGSVPAESLRVSIRAEGALRLATEYAAKAFWGVEAEGLAAAHVRQAPLFSVEKPIWRKRAANILDPDYLRSVYRMPAMDFTPARFVRDRFLFYRVSDEDKDLFTEEIVFECEDFRHGLAPVRVPIAVVLPKEAGSSALTVALSAKRGEPSQRSYRVEHTIRPGDIAQIAENMIAGLMAKLEDDEDN